MIKRILLLIIFTLPLTAQQGGFQIARLKYAGGGDWYNDPSAEVNLLNYIERETNINTEPKYIFVDMATDDIFRYPFLFITGHGNIVFSETEAKRLRTYLENGGFLYVDDDYGLDKAFRREIKKVFPEYDLVELPFDHGVYHSVYDFNNGPPKIHEHDNRAPQGYGLFIDERLAVYYTYESNISDGWADPEVHDNPPEVREKALRFGANLVVWVLSN